MMRTRAGLAGRVAAVALGTGLACLCAPGAARAWWTPYPYYGYGYGYGYPYAPRPVMVVPRYVPYEYRYDGPVPEYRGRVAARPPRRAVHPVRVARPASPVPIPAPSPFAGPGSEGVMPVALPPARPSPFSLVPAPALQPAPQLAPQLAPRPAMPQPAIAPPAPPATTPGPRYEVFPPEADGRSSRD